MRLLLFAGAGLVGLVAWASCALPDDFVKIDGAAAGGGGGGAAGGGGGAGGTAGAGGGLPTECPSAFTGSIPFDCEGFEFDSNNCCAPGRACGIDPESGTAAQCSNGFCAGYRIIDSGTEIRSLAVYDELIVWSTGVDGRVRAAPKDGSGSIEDLAPDDGVREPTFVLAAEGYVFWTSANAPEIFRVDTNATPEEVATTTQGSGMSYGRITSWEGALFFAHDDTIGGIYRADAHELGQTAAKIADAQTPEGIAVDGNAFYFTEPALGQVSRLDYTEIGVGTPQVLATNQTAVSHLVNDANNLYWAMSGAIRTMNKGDESPTDLATSPDIDGTAVMVDDYFVYWVEYDTTSLRGSVWKASKYDGGNAFAMIDDIGDLPVALAQDCDHVYVAFGGGEILRVTK